MNSNNKKVVKGMIIGCVMPIISILFVRFVLIYIPKLSYFKLISLEDLAYSGSLQSTVIQLGIVGNLLVFFYYLQKGENAIQKGIVIPTVILTLLAMITKYNF